MEADPTAADAGQDLRPLVLIIDDDAAMRDSLAAVIEAFGFRTHAAVNGFKGLQAIATLAPAAIITDIHMPDMDGFELLTALRNASTDNPVIAISGGVAKGYDFQSAATKMGAVAAFQKPLPVFEMVDTISRLMARDTAA
jgi:CheY-like chemotaxis protein